MKIFFQSILLFSLILGLMACGDDEIRVYKIDKESLPHAKVEARGSELPPDHPPMPANIEEAPASETFESLHWHPSPQWKEQPAGGMRLASYRAEGKNGLSADISVVSLGGRAGGLLSNVNRWRGQLGLNPFDAPALNTQSKTISTRAGNVILVDFVSDKLLIDQKYKKRLLAGTLFGKGKTWFFKMTGEDRLVQTHRPAFIEFLKSLRPSAS